MTHPVYDAKQLFEALKKEWIYVRFWGSERIEQYLRITIGTQDEMEVLVSFLKILSKRGNNMLKKILQGMVVGIANIIPGVSGGTMMVAMGLYDKLIHSITHLKSEFKESIKLLIPIFAGAGIAIVALSRLFEFLLATYPIPTNFAFCGLIAGSLPFIFQKVKGHSVTVGKMIPFFIFFGVVILMAVLGEDGGSAADVSFGLVNVIKLLGVELLLRRP